MTIWASRGETLAKLVLDNKGEWDRWIGSALYAYRNKEHSATKFSPSFLLYGFKLKTPVELNVIPEKQKSPITVNDHMNLIGKRLKDVRELAKENTKKAHERQQKYYDKHVKQKQFKRGDKVLLYDSATQHTHGNKFRNIYKEGVEFHSFRKVLNEVGAPYSKDVELISLNSVSKGLMGECGLRGGYFETHNLDPFVES